MTEPSWKDELDRNGFVHLPGVLDADSAGRLALLSLRSIEDYAASEDLIRTRDGIPVKLLHPLGKYREFLSMLGRSEVRDIVDVLLPPDDSVLTWEDVLVKPPAIGVEVGVHQDIGLDPTRDTVHSLGISLNGDDDNPVHFLPGSHRLGPLTTPAVQALWRDCREQFQPVVTRAGDIVIHNVHVLHYSDANQSDRPRATWYLEFRSMRSLLEKGPWSGDWVHRRRAIWAFARAVGGDVATTEEPEPVQDYLHRLRAGAASLRVPQVTEAVQYDGSSPYNHFSSWNDDWRSSRLAPDGTHHVRTSDGRPLYRARFHEVLKFHAPGLAPVLDSSGAYHVTPDGQPAYEFRYVRTFGFYEGIAAVQATDGWRHIGPDGAALYPERHSWCGNFQEGRCPVRDGNGQYFHILPDGRPAYAERYRYAGDFRDGYAVVQDEAGRHTHIDPDGHLLHGKWFLDLDVFHKGHARAADVDGWHHVDTMGRPLYEARFGNVEPFYNGQARVTGHDGSLSVIGENGDTVVVLREPARTPLEELSGDMVGVWRTQAIRAAVELGVFELLPASSAELEARLELAPSNGTRLLRAMLEMALVRRNAAGVYHPTQKGAHLRSGHEMSLTDAASHWGDQSNVAWQNLAESLRTGLPPLPDGSADFFRRMSDRPDELAASHRTFAAYAKHDYAALPEIWDFGQHYAILDAGGSTGELAFALLRAYPNLTATVMDRPEVANLFAPTQEFEKRCRFVAGDLFRSWPVRSNAVILARVLHDWPDHDARRILTRARDAMDVSGHLYLVEMLLDASGSAGGLLDLNMLVMTGGRERPLTAFEQLLGETGFRLADVRPTSRVNSLIRAQAV